MEKNYEELKNENKNLKNEIIVLRKQLNDISEYCKNIAKIL